MKVNKELTKKIVNGIVIAAGIITTADQVHSGLSNVKDKLNKGKTPKQKTEEA